MLALCKKIHVCALNEKANEINWRERTEKENSLISMQVTAGIGTGVELQKWKPTNLSK